MRQPRIDTYADAMKQANREAGSTVVALAVIIVVWLVSGFGLSGTDIWIFHTPLWVICGCVAPWIAAAVAAVVLGYKVFADVDLDFVAKPIEANDSRDGAFKNDDASHDAVVSSVLSASEGGQKHHG